MCASAYLIVGDRERPTDQLPYTTVPDPGDAVTTHASIVTQLRTLPPRQRAAIVLRYYEDLSEAQTADVMGCSVGAVKSQVFTGLGRLRERLGANFLTDPHGDEAVNS